MPTTIASDDRLHDAAAANDDGARLEHSALSESLHVPGRADAAIRRFGARLKDIDATVEQARLLAERTSERIRERPLTAIGIAAGVGLIAGLLARFRH